MLILSTEFRTRFFSWIHGDKVLVSLFRREREAAEIVAGGSQSYKGYKHGNYSFGGVFLIKFSVVFWFVLIPPLKYVIYSC